MRTNKYLYVWIVQGNYGCGWEDVGGGTFKQARDDIKAYRANAPEYRYRMVHRRELNPEWRPE